MAFRAAQRRDDAHQRHALRQAQRLACRQPVAGREALEVDAGGDRCHARRRYPGGADELLANRLAGGDDLRHRPGIQPARGRAAGQRRRTVAGVHQRRRPLLAQPAGTAGKRREPAIRRTVTVDDVDALAGQRAAQRDYAHGARAPHRQGEHRDRKAFRGREDRRMTRAGDTHVVPTAAQSGSFGENAEFRSAPFERGLRVQNAHRVAGPVRQRRVGGRGL